MNKTNEKKLILEILDDSEQRLTPINLIKNVVIKTRIPSNSAKKILKDLISEKELEYTYFFGSTYIERAFNKPVKITERFVLTPPGIKKTNNKNHINILIDPGISFGSGRHPTTRLSLMALDCAITSGLINQQRLESSNDNPMGLDIGTGSGVLAIAACKTCVSNCLALDIDPNSLAEAKKNVILNNLETKIKISGSDINNLKEKFSLILANLRFPTLKNLSQGITLLSEENTVLIMSGIRTHEKENLIKLYTNHGFKKFYEKDEKNWSCVAMQIKKFKAEN
jgi:ribosomal protein L11 methyltransferase